MTVFLTTLTQPQFPEPSLFSDCHAYPNRVGGWQAAAAAQAMDLAAMQRGLEVEVRKEGEG